MKSDLLYYISKVWGDIRYPFRNFYIGVSNIIRWIPILYKDRNWDHYYILPILVFKLKLTRKKLAEDNIVCDEELSKMLESLDQCIDLFEKVNDEWGNYEEPMIDNVNKKWGAPIFNFIDVEKNLKQLDIKHPNILNDEDYKNYRMDMENAYKQIEKNWNQDFEKAMEIFRSNIRTWWD